jgi:hypothetical protein
VGDLLGKHPDMAERGQPPVKVDAEQLHRPGFTERDIGKCPSADAVLVGVSGKHGVRLVPFRIRQAAAPQRLRFRPDDPQAAILFELLALAGLVQPHVEQPVAVLVACFQDQRCGLLGQSPTALYQRSRRRLRLNIPTLGGCLPVSRLPVGSDARVRTGASNSRLRSRLAVPGTVSRVVAPFVITRFAATLWTACLRPPGLWSGFHGSGGAAASWLLGALVGQGPECPVCEWGQGTGDAMTGDFMRVWT